MEREGEVERRGTTEENTQSCTQRQRHTSYGALGSLVNLLNFLCLFFLPRSVSLLEVYRSMTDNRELLRWFIQGQGPVFI